MVHNCIEPCYALLVCLRQNKNYLTWFPKDDLSFIAFITLKMKADHKLLIMNF